MKGVCFWCLYEEGHAETCEQLRKQQRRAALELLTIEGEGGANYIRALEAEERVRVLEKWIDESGYLAQERRAEASEAKCEELRTKLGMAMNTVTEVMTSSQANLADIASVICTPNAEKSTRSEDMSMASLRAERDALKRRYETCDCEPGSTCRYHNWKTVTELTAERDRLRVALNLVSGALVDAGGIKVPSIPEGYAAAVAVLASERDRFKAGAWRHEAAHYTMWMCLQEFKDVIPAERMDMLRRDVNTALAGADEKEGTL